jgi:hypothetical protein
MAPQPPEELILIDEETRLAVVAKLNELARIPVGTASGRRLTAEDLHNKGITITPEQLHIALGANFYDVATKLGIQFFQALPVAVLEQFVLRAIMRDEDSAGLLKSLINSFMLTYLTEETSAEAFTQLLGLEALRGRLAKSRSVTQRPMTPHPSPTSH